MLLRSDLLYYLFKSSSFYMLLRQCAKSVFINYSTNTSSIKLSAASVPALPSFSKVSLLL